MLLHKIEQFLRQSGMPWTKFGRIVAHDPRLVGDMRNGRNPREAMCARIEAFIAAGEAPAAEETPHAF
ncbi:MAG TPA: hypothetical protein VFF98_01950 [Novosphingobium sp.]|nr:hypothetical protein [Novosphingobium sp.]HZV08236.1 hypothetical protein [Novosphingobium sp.]